MLLGLAAFLLCCTRTPGLPPDDRAAVQEALSFPGVPKGVRPTVEEGPAVAVPGGTLAPLRLDLGAPTETGAPFYLAGAILRPDKPTGAGVIVAHGHFEGGKSTPEAQQIARRLVARGALVVILDSPGVEEWDVPGRRIHFGGGAHNRAFLAAGGSSALALQVTALRRAVDLLKAEGARRIGATGPSGGATQSFWLGLVDPRVSALALASVPPTPRELRARGCACDQLPGWPGPDPRVLATLQVPTLWMSEVVAPRPDGLGSAVTYEVVEGEHGFTEAMQRRAVDFLGQQLSLSTVPWEDEVPVTRLRAEPADPATGPAIFDLQLHPTAQWTPAPPDLAPYELDCEGVGPVVIVAGGDATDRRALVDAGLQPCTLSVPTSAADQSEAIGSRTALADLLTASIARAGRTRKAVAAWGVRAWGLPVAASGLPFVVRDPLLDVHDVDVDRDPAWVHVPGAWWGTTERLLSRALATGEDPEALARALAEAAP